MKPNNNELVRVLLYGLIILTYSNRLVFAAESSVTLNVTVTVIASCTVSPLPVVALHATILASSKMCETPAMKGAVAPRPQISVEYDAAGVRRQVFTF